MPSTARVVETAMRLRAADGEAWSHFVVAIREYAAQQTMDMVNCAPDMLPRAQGMAITANDIATTLLNAPKLYDKMVGRNG